MSEPADLEDLRRRYFVGLAKSGGDSSINALGTFALAAMRSRFARTLRHAHSGTSGLVLSGEPLLPDAARALLIRLCAAKQTDQLASAAVNALHRAGLRPHPFDFYRLEEFIVRFAGELGATAQSWANRLQPGQVSAPGDDDDSATEETFGNASRAGKLHFLRTLRASQPDRARDVVALHFSKEPATHRSDFLDVLAVKLGEADLAILIAATSDKAQSVRAKADALLQKIPGTPAYKERLARLPDYIKVKTALVSRKKTLSLTGLSEPIAVKLSQLCAGLRLADIAATLGLGVEDLVAAASEVADLADVILSAVIAERKFDFIHFFESMLEEGGWQCANVLHEALPHASAPDRDVLIHRLVVPRRWKKMPEAFSLQRFYAGLAGSLPVAPATDLLNAKVYKEMLAKDPSPALTAQIEALAPLIPRALSETFIAEVRHISPRAALFHQFLLALPETTKG